MLTQFATRAYRSYVSSDTVERLVDIAESSYQSIPFIADLHCDALLWNRDFLVKHDFGHVDLPRMQEANMALQIFTIVSKTPRGMNIEHNDDKTDNIALLSFGQLQPVKNWFSIKSRAIWQANQLHKFAEKSNGDFRVISSQKQLKQFVVERTKNPKNAMYLMHYNTSFYNCQLC